jgi:hypothetical protein
LTADLVGPLVLAVLLALMWATVFLSDRVGRRRARAAGFLRGAGFYLAVRSLVFDPPTRGERCDQGHTALRIAWFVRNDWTGRRGLPATGVGLLVDGVTYAPVASEPTGELVIPARTTAELVTSYRLPTPVAERLAAGELGLAATLRLDPAAAAPLAVVPLDLGRLPAPKE